MNSRLTELDTLRGLSVFGMILVINPGNWSHQFEWMRHATWQGFPLADMIFPTFLFCIGISITLSFSRKMERQEAYSYLLKKTLIRSLLMVGIGLFINAFPYFDFSNMRIPGVIQRIGICYFITSNIYLAILFSQIKPKILWLLVVSLLILIGYYALLQFVPTPTDIPKIGKFYSWPALIDQKLFGINHIWPYERINSLISYDPDGLVASLPASVNILFGIILGEVIKYHRSYYRVKYTFLVGTLLIILGFLLDFYHIDLAVKKFWTSSFVLFSGGFSLLVLTLINVISDKLKNRTKIFYPFIVFGSNALLSFIVSYLCMSLMDSPLIMGETFRQISFDFIQMFIPHPVWASFLFSLLPLIIYFSGFRFMYVKGWFVKL